MSEWISVNDRLPEAEQDVLILVRETEFYGKHLEKRHIYKWLYTGWCVDGCWASTYCFGHRYIAEEQNERCELTVTHWMSLPKFPERE